MKMADGGEPVSIDPFPNTMFKNASTVLLDLTVFRQVVKVILMFTSNASDKWLVWKKENEAVFDQAPKKKE